DDVAVLLAHELERDRCGAGRHVEHGVATARLDARDQKAPPPRILAERENRGPAVVGGSKRREEGRGIHTLDSMALADDLERIPGAAAEHGTVTGVLAAEPTRGRRFYLVAFEGGGWLVFDAEGAAVLRRADVRDAASIVAMNELAGDLAGGGNLEALRAQLAQVRMVEQPPGIEEAEDAALALERTIGSPPRVATPEYLDQVGAA